MNYSKLFKLGLVAGIMVALAMLVSMPKGSGDKAVAAHTPLIQGLDTRAITAIEVSGDGKKARLVKTETGFVVESRNNYPALYEEVNKLLVICLDIKVSEFVTANPDNYIDLQVDEVSASRLIKFFNAEGKLIAGVVIGKTDIPSERSYVRTVAADEKTATKVYLADIEYQKDPANWIYSNPVSYVENGLLKCQEEDIAGISVTNPEGSYNIVVKTDEAGVVTPELQDIPDGKKVNATEVKQVLTDAIDISFDDLQLAADTDTTLEFNHKYVVATADQTEITLQLAKGNVNGAEKFFVKCSSRYTNKEFMDQVRTGNIAVGKDMDSMQAADDKIQIYQATQDFNARHKNWVYVMESYKGTKLTKKLTDLTYDIANSKSAEEPAVGPAITPAAPVN